MVLVVEEYDTSMLGELLLAERTEADLSVSDLSSSTGLCPDRIEAVETGRHDLDDGELERLLRAYDVAPPTGRFTDLVVEVNLDKGWASMKRVRRRASDRPSADSNLLSYLSLVYQDRELPLGAEIPIRSIDLSLLRPALAIRRPEVEVHLGRLKGDPSEESRRYTSILEVALGVGVVVAAGAIILVPTSAANGTQSAQLSEAASEAPAVSVDPRLEIGTAMVIERATPPLSSTDTAGNATAAATPTIQVGTAQVVERTLDEAVQDEAVQD